MKLNMRHMAALVVLPFLFVLITAQSSAQVFRAGPQVASFYSEIDDSEQPYGLYVPPGYTPEKSYPLVIMLHGAMSNHRLALRRVFGKSNFPGQNDAEASRVFPPWKDEQYIVVSPYARGTMGYVGIPEADVIRVIEECKANFNIDENRVYLTGLSMGGGGTLYIGLTRPDLFAAIAPVCPAPPESAYDLMANALNLPVNIYQGGADPVVKAEGTRLIVDELLKGGASVEYHEFPGVQHDVWVQSYANGNIFRWFEGIVRNPFPEKVHFSTQWLKYNHAYWVTVDQKVPGVVANIDARFNGPNSLEVKTNNMEAFTFNLKGHPRFNPSEPLNLKINNIQIQSAPKFSHAFRMKEGKWLAEKQEAAVVAKKKGLEGPMFEICTSRFLVVFGTEKSAGMDDINARRSFAMDMANFAVGFGGYQQQSLINPRVLADRQVTADDYLSSNLVLIGTKESNSVIAKLADKLPLHLTGNTGEYGLVYNYPVNGKMVLVVSGIPFWTTAPQQGANQAQAAGRSRTRIAFGTGAGLKALQGRKDILFFKGTNDQPIADGWFDTEWKLPADISAALKASGALEVK